MPLWVRLLSFGVSICLLQCLPLADAYTHSSVTTCAIAPGTPQKFIQSGQNSQMDEQHRLIKRTRRSYMISSALENIALSVQSNALLSDCITVCLSTAFSDLVAQNTERGQKLLSGKRDGSSSKCTIDRNILMCLFSTRIN